MVDYESIVDVLRTVPDPELPVNIVDLGLVENVFTDSPLPSGEGSGVRAERDSVLESPSPQPSPKGRGSLVTITLLPTFIGCPALDMIEGDVRAKVNQLDGISDVTVKWIYDPPWTVDRITPGGRAALKQHGVTVPDHGSKLSVPGHTPGRVELRTSAIACPFCGSISTYLDSAFGPTKCRTIHYCSACRNSFENMRPSNQSSE